MGHIQVLTPGYQVVVTVDGQEYDYRASQNGFFFLCDLAVLPLEQKWWMRIASEP